MEHQPKLEAEVATPQPSPVKMEANRYGSVYQLKLLMLFLKRGLNHGYSFRLTLEKFEDVLFQRTDKASNRQICRFMQIKHAPNDSIAIDMKAFLDDENSNFSLKRCFLLYRVIKQDPEIGKTLKDFVICTRADVDEEIKDWFQIDYEQDSILDYGELKCKQLKFRKSFPGKEDLVSKIQEVSVVFMLAKKLAECVLEKKPVSMDDDLFRKFHVVLGAKVLNSRNCIHKEMKGKNRRLSHYFVKFRKDFLQGNSPEVDTFRHAFAKAYQSMAPPHQMDVWSQLKTVELRVSPAFVKKPASYWAKLPNDAVPIGVIEEFLDTLVFAVNQPSMKQLDSVIGDEMGDHKTTKLIGHEVISCIFQDNLLNWMKSTKTNTLTHQDGVAFFEQVKYQLVKMGVMFPGMSCESKMEQFGLVFTKELPRVVDFLNSTDKQILNTVSFTSTELSTLKVYQAVLRHQAPDSCICLTLNCLQHMRHRLIKMMMSNESYNVLILECRPTRKNSNTMQTEVREIYSHLKDFFNYYPNRKIILVTYTGNLMSAEFKKDFPHAYEEWDDVTGNVTDLASPKLLLKSKQVIFQGNPVYLDELVDENSQRLIDDEVLSKLITNFDIQIGSKRSDLRPLDTLTRRSSRKVKVEHLRELFQMVGQRHVMVVSGLRSKNEACELLSIRQEEVKNYGESLDVHNDKCVLLTGGHDEKHLKSFKEVSNEFEQMDLPWTAHLINVKGDEITWNYSYDKFYYVQRNFIGILINRDTLKKVVEQESRNIRRKIIFAISGLDNASQQLGEVTAVEDIPKDEHISEQIEDVKPVKRVLIVNIGNVNDTKGFEDLCKKVDIKSYNIHWLQNEDNGLHWLRSRGDVHEMYELFGDGTGQLAIDENLLLDRDNVTVIAGEPGSGKSTTLKYLAEKLSKSEWVILLTLSAVKAKLEWMKGDNSLENIIEEFIGKTNVWVTDKFARELLRHRILEQGNITLMFDGFDEIDTKHQDKVIQLLKKLRFTKARIVVSTRSSVKDRLEKAFCVLAWDLAPFTDEQLSVLKSGWTSSLKLMNENAVDEEVLHNYVDKLTRLFHKNIRDGMYEPIAIPMLLKIFAVTQQSYIEEFCRNQNTLQEIDTLSLSDLYEQFVKRKHDDCVKEKTKLFKFNDTSALYFKRTCIDNHRGMAFHKLFNVSRTEHYELYRIPTRKQMTDLDMVGIVHQKQFIHRSFGEYFIADMLVNFLKVLRNEESPEYKRTRNFLIVHIPKDSFKVILKFITQKVESERHELLSRRWNQIKGCQLSVNVPLKYKLTIANGSPEAEDSFREAAKEPSAINLRNEVESRMQLLSTWQHYTDEYFCNDNMKIIDAEELFRENFTDRNLRGMVESFRLLHQANARSLYKTADRVCAEFIQKERTHYFTQCAMQGTIDESEFMEVYHPLTTEPLVIEAVELLAQLRSETIASQKIEPIHKLVHLLIPYATQTTHAVAFLETLSFLCMYVQLFHPTVTDLLKSYISTNYETKQEYISRTVQFATKIPYELQQSQSIETLRGFFNRLFHDEDLKSILAETFAGKEQDWLSSDGLRIICFLEILTPELSERYQQNNEHPTVDEKRTDSIVSWDFQFGTIKYLLNRIQQEIAPRVDKPALLKLLMGILARFLATIHLQRTQLTFTSRQLRTTLELISGSFSIGLIPSASTLAENVRCLHLLASAGLKLIDADGILLVADTASDFQHRMIEDQVAHAIQVCYWLKENAAAMTEAILQKCSEIIRSGKRRIADDGLQGTKRPKFDWSSDYV
ncbi:uncharacterized protein LOC131683917 [Topomyia yanbarensis]|uniref:uncharacterized protein LOC131683917 n=1 Tax=Topomyia yanbarensis TaxID=2498891 RepID=UPI00273B71EA|nr:uncharacterized protein LOC131683917 [Topomyia yanbarensis]